VRGLRCGPVVLQLRGGEEMDARMRAIETPTALVSPVVASLLT
jgi:hypothetical protein